MPAAPEVELESGNEADRVIRWRIRALERSGFDPESARQLGERLDVDAHRAADLLRSGCPAETVVRILL